MKGKCLKPFFIFGSLGVPIIAISLVLAVQHGFFQYLPVLFILWGVAFTLFQVSSLPYVMRNTDPENQSHAISLNYATHSFGTILSGIFIFLSGQFIPAIDEGKILLLISSFGFIGVYFLLKMDIDVVVPIKEELQWNSYDLAVLIKAITPTLIIAVGACLTIPFINLFFFHNFQIDSLRRIIF